MLTHQEWFNLLYMQPLHAPQANEFVICIPIYIRAPHRHISIDIIIPLLNKYFNRISDHADYPEPWSYSIIVSILKKGNANAPNNYRGISLLDVLGKIYTSILTRRVTFYTNIFSKISEYQAGFRDGYSTTDQAFILYSLIHKYLSKKRGFIC